ncbi:glycoside hydrolase superfamily [Apiosordaria backusii]|uniref:Beta-mannosidase B n=1 Tax=Apiosordaria backusii TaxID=314023 RepID=A0AA39ZSK3_9PEZI|nr:glycoside hydrolase superfamily [Apiosordaria backusii]
MPPQPHTTHLLTSSWKFQRQGDSQWQSVPHLPSDVHTELINSNLLPHPFLDLNELTTSWVAEQTWVYRLVFPTPAEATQNPDAVIDLVFEGLDTFTAITLNGKIIKKTDNMFVSWRVNINEFLLRGSTKEKEENVLDITFHNARERGLQLVKDHPEHQFIVHQTEVSRGPVRKAQYHWGWDWGPILMTCGPWRPVRMEVYESMIQEVVVNHDVDLTDGGERPKVEVGVRVGIVGAAGWVEVDAVFEGRTVVAFRGEQGRLVQNGTDPGAWEYSTPMVRLEGPKLWWPRGYGAQNLYDVRVRIFDKEGGSVLAEHNQKIGFRKAELIQESDEYGQSFYFRINDVDVFAAGSNWIPADSFLSQVTPERYRDWIQNAVADGNQNMIRVWGGGVYEPDAFYDACDELGILVWQDFMFACASYPTYPEFLESVEMEARHNVQRLRNHPSIVLWCGSNEDYQIQERYQLDNDRSDMDPESWLKSSFPARYIYEQLLPAVVMEESPSPNTLLYHLCSPFGNGASTTLKVDPTVGDIHQWNLWHGDAKPFQRLPEMGGRFVSEFGMEAYPHFETVQKFVTDPKELYPGSKTLDFHNKAIGYERRLLTYLGENYRLVYDIKGFIHLTQILQADSMATAYKSWRRDWQTQGGKARKCGGVLVWQLNDCWPTISWAVVDYYGVKKPAWYAIKQALAPIAVGVSRKFWDWTTRPADQLWKRDTGHADPTLSTRKVVYDVWVSSDGTLHQQRDKIEGTVKIRCISIATGKDILFDSSASRTVLIEPNRVTNVSLSSEINWERQQEEPIVVCVTLWIDGQKVSSDISWPDPLKYLDLSERGLHVEYIGHDQVRISAEKPVKGFVFSEKEAVKLSDNGFDVLPGEPVVVKVEGAKAQELEWTFVGQGQ